MMKKMMLMIIVALVLTGCQGGNRKKLYGYWKCEQKDQFTSQTEIIILNEKGLSLSVKDQPTKISYKYKDGVFVLQHAGTDFPLFTVELVDKNHMDSTNGLCSRYVRSTRNEIEKLHEQESKPKQYRPLRPGYGSGN